MTVLAQLSDPHFGTEVADVVDAARRSLAALKPDAILLTGDVTQRARPEQFRAASAFLSSLPSVPTLVIPGNHDIPLYNVALRVAVPYRQFLRAFGAREGIWSDGRVGVVGYDTTSRWRHTRGRLGKDALLRGIDRVRKTLAADGLLVACTHQPLATALAQDRHEALIRAEETARLFAENGVDLALSGHVHMPLIATTQEAFPDLTRPFVLAGAGTAVSWRTRSGAPNAFNVLRLDAAARTIAVQEYRFDEVAREFTAGEPVTFAGTASGWAAA